MRSEAMRGARGREGEEKAAEYLAGKGYTVLARNFRARTGEVDIIAQKDGTLVFVEVKNWRIYGKSELEYSIGRTKQRKIENAARLFLLRKGWREDMRTRFDVVLMGGDGSEGGVLHIEDAFSGAVH
jgi:putative endonuclease